MTIVVMTHEIGKRKKPACCTEHNHFHCYIQRVCELLMARFIRLVCYDSGFMAYMQRKCVVRYSGRHWCSWTCFESIVNHQCSWWLFEELSVFQLPNLPFSLQLARRSPWPNCLLCLDLYLCFSANWPYTSLSLTYIQIFRCSHGSLEQRILCNCPGFQGDDQDIIACLIGCNDIFLVMYLTELDSSMVWGVAVIIL